MEREPYEIPEGWHDWGGTFFGICSIQDWDVILWQPPGDDDPDFILMRPGNCDYSFIRLSDGYESLSRPPPPDEVLTFARSYRALVS